ALLGFFRQNPQYLTGAMNLEKNADYLFPYFIVTFLRYGLAGLVISGMLAAAMSSLSSGVNSASTVINKDFLEHFFDGGLSERQKVRMGKWATVGIGALVILLGFVVGKVQGNIVEVTNKTNGLFVAPLFGLFFLAMFVPFATPYGAVFGSLYGFVAGFLVAFSGDGGGPSISFQWIITASLIANIVSGCAISAIPIRTATRPVKILVCAAFALPLVAAMIGYTVLACAN
ncbi:MAG: hypothetical protein JXR94_06520, partial [Candidatus Hydrogenedentes bacterium]|nr:hypothetical protein [Candidatus Hydrogenedentota bacterium]